MYCIRRVNKLLLPMLQFSCKFNRRVKVDTKPQRVAVGFVDPGLFHFCCGGGLNMGTLLVMDTVARAQVCYSEVFGFAVSIYHVQKARNLSCLNGAFPDGQKIKCIISALDYKLGFLY